MLKISPILAAFIGGLLTIAVSAGPRSALASAGQCSGEAAGIAFACRTWPEIAAALKTGTTTIIVPVGGTEQSGPFIAVGKHNVRAEALADTIAERLGQTLVAPVIAYVPEGSTTPRTSHMRFPGTISVPVPVFEGVVRGAAESFRVQGFRTIVLIGDHGGYQAALAHVARDLERAWGGQAHVLYLRAYYDVIPTRYADALRAQGHAAEVGEHAELSDTSLMLAVDPSLVRQTALRAAAKPGAADGVYGGDPRHATADLGRIGTEMQVQAAVAAIQSFHRSHS